MDTQTQITASPANSPLTRPCLPPGLALLLEAESGKAWYPPVVDDKQRAWIKSLMPSYSALLTPAHGDKLTARITALLLHFFVSGIPANVHEVLLSDWEKALSDLPMWAIDTACERWIATQTIRPKPAEIRTLASAAVADLMDEAAKLKAIVEHKPGQSNLPDVLRSSVDAVKIRAWAEKCTATLEGDMVVIHAPSPYHRDGIERCLGPEIAAAYRGKRVVYLTKGQRTGAAH